MSRTSCVGTPHADRVVDGDPLKGWAPATAFLRATGLLDLSYEFPFLPFFFLRAPLLRWWAAKTYPLNRKPAEQCLMPS